MSSVTDRENHAQRYRNSCPAAIAAELEVLGSDYQANGYTTRSQADRLGELLRLEQTSLLIDLGSGCGWPGLHLAVKHGCQVLTVDPVVDGSRVATKRAAADVLTQRAWSVVGFGEALPIRRGVADAIVHTDVLC